MAHAEQEAVIDVLVCFSPQPREVEEVPLQLPTGSTVAQAMQDSGLLAKQGLALDEQ